MTVEIIEWWWWWWCPFFPGHSRVRLARCERSDRRFCDVLEGGKGAGSGECDEEFYLRRGGGFMWARFVVRAFVVFSAPFLSLPCLVCFCLCFSSSGHRFFREREMFSVRPSGRRLPPPPHSRLRDDEVLEDTRKYSNVLEGPRKYLRVFEGTRRYSKILDGTRKCLDVYEAPRKSNQIIGVPEGPRSTRRSSKYPAILDSGILENT